MCSNESKENFSWSELALNLLSAGTDSDRQAVLAMLAGHPSLSSEQAGLFLQAATDLLLDPDPEVRYFARKVRSKLEKLAPKQTETVESAGSIAENQQLTLRDILLHKMRLGSRYVAFDAIERLTDTADPALAEPLIEALQTETDPFKISYLVKRLPRIPVADIPAAIEPFLRHSDPRIVANTLEGLAQCDVPRLQKTFNELADSPDNRIRAAAIQALYKYDKLKAEQKLQEMLESDSIAMQDSGVFLLARLRPQNLNSLLEIPLASKFPTIRLRALDIPRHASETAIIAAIEKQKQFAVLEDDELQKGLFWSLLLCSVLILLSSVLSNRQTFFTFLAISAAVALLSRKTAFETRVWLSIGTAACMLWSGTPLIAILALLAVWHPTRVEPENRISQILSWVFTISACLISAFATSHEQTLVKTAVAMGNSIKGPIGDLRSAASQLMNLETASFVFTAVWTYLLLRINKWFGGQTGAKRRLTTVFCMGILVLCAIAIGKSWSLKFNLATLGVSNPAQLFSAPGK